MNLYTVDYWVPFPMSEYGGLYVIAAENVDQVVEVCMEDTREWRTEGYADGAEDRIKKNTKLIGTTDLFKQPCVVNSFWT